MVSAQRELLDQLMGADRNLPPELRPNVKKKYTDHDVCKFFLVRFCPHHFFVNTKSDLGPCDKIHDENLQREYQQSRDRGRLGYEQDFVSYMSRIISSLDHKIKLGHERLGKQLDDTIHNPIKDAHDEKVALLDAKIQDTIAQMEKCGEEGKVDEASRLLKSVEQLKAEMEALKQQGDANPMIRQDRLMEICDICGAMLHVGDVKQRQESHLEGKQHTGYKKIREAIAEVKEEMKTSRGGSDKEDDKDRRDRDRERDRDRDYDRDRDRRDRDRRDRDRDRGRRDRDRSRSPGRSRR